MCLQETNFTDISRPKLKGFEIYSKPFHNPRRACGGVAIFIKSCYHSIEIDLTSSLQAIAVGIYFPVKMTICSIYLPPDLEVSQNELNSLISQLPSPFILCGDFNAHNVL